MLYRHAHPGDWRPLAAGRSWASSTLEWGLGLQVPLPRPLSKLLMCGAVVSALAGLVVFLSFSDGSWENLAGVVAADLGGTLWLLLWLGKTPQGKLVVNPLTGMLALYTLRRLMGFIYVMGQGSSLASPFYGVPTLGYITSSAKAEWVTLVGTAAFCLGWVLSRRRQGNSITALPLTGWRDRYVWAGYCIGLGVFLTSWLYPGGVTGFGNVVTITSGLAYGAVFVLLAFSRDYGIQGRRRLLTYAALLPLTANVLTHGMKSTFFFVLLPVGAAYLLKRPGRGLALSTVGVFFLLVFVYPYVEEYREVNWRKSSSASVGEVTQQVQKNIEREGVTKTVDSSWDKFQLRFGSVNEAGAVVYFSDKSGFMGGFFLQNLMYGFIPRFLWPEKPSWDPAGWFTAYLAGGTYTPGMASSTALHIGPELYWMFAWPGTVVGLLILGLFYRRVSDWLLMKGSASPVYWLAWYSFLQFVTFIEEVRFNTAILTPFILLANVITVSWLVKLFVPRRTFERTSSLLTGA